MQKKGSKVLDQCVIMIELGYTIFCGNRTCMFLQFFVNIKRAFQQPECLCVFDKRDFHTITIIMTHVSHMIALAFFNGNQSFNYLLNRGGVDYARFAAIGDRLRQGWQKMENETTEQKLRTL